MCDLFTLCYFCFFPYRRYFLKKIKGGKDIQSPFLGHGKSFGNKIICFL